MAKEERPTEADGLLAVACRKRAGEYEVVTIARVGGKQVESIVKKTTDRRIAADRLQQALLGSGL